MKLAQTFILGSVVVASAGFVGATPTPTNANEEVRGESDSVVSQAPRGLEMKDWVGGMIEAEIVELERLRLEVEGDVGSEVSEKDEGAGDDGEKAGEGEGERGEGERSDGDDDHGDEEPDGPKQPEEPKHPKHPKDDKHERKHKHGDHKGEKKHKHKGDKHEHEHKHKHGKGGKHRDGPPPHGPPPHGPPHGGPHGGPPRHHPHGPPSHGGPPGHKKGEDKDKAPRPPHRDDETGGPDDEESMDEFFRAGDQDGEAMIGEAGDEHAERLSMGPLEGEDEPVGRGRHHHHRHHNMSAGRGRQDQNRSHGFSHQMSASLAQFKPLEAMVLVITFTLGLISMIKTAVMLFFFAKRGGRGGKRGWMKHMGVRGGGRHGPGHKRGLGRGGRGGRKSGSGSSGGSGSEDEGANLLVVLDEKYRDDKA